MSAFSKMFGGSCGAVIGVAVGILLLVALLIGGCSLMVGGCAVAVDSLDEAQEAARKAAEEPVTPATQPEPPGEELLAPSDPAARTWTAANGNFTVEAIFRGMAFGKVKLEKTSNGNVIEVPLEKLCDADQEWIRKQGR